MSRSGVMSNAPGLLVDLCRKAGHCASVSTQNLPTFAIIRCWYAHFSRRHLSPIFTTAE